MFKALLAHRTRNRPRLGALSGAAALHFFVLGGCELDERPGDGLVSDGLEVTVSPTTKYETGGSERDASMDVPCKALPIFQEKVLPHLKKSCALDCHDGTKQKAAFALNMGFFQTDLMLSCNWMLNVGAPMDLDKLQAPLLTSSDPGRHDKVHDFKYKTAAEFIVYRDDVMAWLNAERP